MRQGPCKARFQSSQIVIQRQLQTGRSAGDPGAVPARNSAVAKRPDKAGCARFDGELRIQRCCNHPATLRDQFGGDDRSDPGEPVIQPPFPLQLRPDCSPRRVDPGPRIAHGKVQRGQPVRLAIVGVDCAVERSETQPPVLPSSVEPGADQRDATQFRRAEAVAGQQLHAFDGEVGVLRRSDHDVGDHLPAGCQFDDLVGRRYVEGGQLLLDNVAGEPFARKPQHRGHAEQQEQRHQQAAPRQATLAPGAAGRLGRCVLQSGIALGHRRDTCALARAKAMHRSVPGSVRAQVTGACFGHRSRRHGG